MDNLTFICPKCHQTFSVNDFNQDEQSLAHIKEWFANHEKAYREDLSKKIKEQLNDEFNSRLITAKTELRNQLMSEHNGEINKKDTMIATLEQKILQAAESAKSDLFNAQLQWEAKAKAELNDQKRIIDGLQNELLQTKKDWEAKNAYNLVEQAGKMDADFNKRLSEKEQMIISLRNECEKTKSEQEQLVANAKLQSQNSYQAMLNQKEIEINALQSKIETAKKDTELQLSQRDQHWSAEKASMELTYQTKIKELETSLLEKRNIKTGIMGSNLENGFQEMMSSMFLSDIFEKTTKPINGRKPDFMLTIPDPQDSEKTFGKILFEIKAGENIERSNWEDKLNKEIIEWNANYGLIVAQHLRVPFERSANYENIYYVNAEVNVFVFIVNILKMSLVKQGMLYKANANMAQDQERWIKLQEWKSEVMSVLMGKSLKELDKVRDQADKIKSAAGEIEKAEGKLRNDMLLKIKSDLDEMLK